MKWGVGEWRSQNWERFPKLGTVPKNWERLQNWEPDSPAFSSKIFLMIAAKHQVYE